MTDEITRRIKDGRPVRTRHEEVGPLIDEMRNQYVIEEGLFSALGMLITDAVLSHDEATLREAHDGLRRLYGHHPNSAMHGRLNGQIDITYWALRRVG